MKKTKKKFQKCNFIDSTFGDNVEYIKVVDDKGITIMYGIANKIMIKNTKEIIEKYIEKCMEKEFLESLLEEQEIEIKISSDEIYD